MRTYRVACMLACAILLLSGCDQGVQINQQNVTGAWSTNFYDLEVTLLFNADGTYRMLIEDRPQSQTEGGAGLMMLSGWTNYAVGANWRLSEDEIVLSDEDGATIAGLPMIIKRLSADELVIQLGEKAPILFTRTTAPTGAAAPPPAPIPGVEDEEPDSSVDNE